MSLSIEFSSPLKGLIPEPKPSTHFISQTYKKLSDEVEYTPTVKKCIPFRDALLTGYILPIPVDYRFRYDFENKRALFEMNPNLPPIIQEKLNMGFHPNFQLSDEMHDSLRTVNAVFKFMNQWVVKTPPGYSCFFTQPFNRNLPFKIIDAVVDTDNFFSSVKLPFYWRAPVKETLILESGSPMCLVIPFKRENWKMKINFKKEKIENRVNFFRKFWDNYKTHSWSKKTYK